MLSLLFYKVIDIIFSRVSIPTIIILSIAILILSLIYTRDLRPFIKISLYCLLSY